MRPLTKRENRIIALALLAGLLALVWSLLLLPLTHWLQDRTEARELLVEQLAADERLAAALPSLKQDYQQLRDKAATSPELIPGASSALAAAALQGQVKSIIEANGGEVRILQTLPPAKEGEDFEKIGLQLDFQALQSKLPEMVYQLDAHQPDIFIDGLEIHVPEGIPTTSGPILEPKLSVRLKVSGYRWIGG